MHMSSNIKNGVSQTSLLAKPIFGENQVDDCSALTDWLIAIGTISLAIIAIFQDKIRSYFLRPQLDCKIESKPPYFHRTESKAENISFYSYYCWFEIWNNGNISAKNVEVIISDLFKKEGDDFVPVKDFFSDNLKWSLISDIRGAYPNGVPIIVPKIYCDYISPKTFKPCNLGHIHDPRYRNNFPGEHNPSLPVGENESIYCFEVNFKSNKLNYLMPPGNYKFTITIGSENAKTIRKKYLMEVTGKWSDDELRMLNEGLKISETK